MNMGLDELRSHGMMGEAVRNFYWDSHLLSPRISEIKHPPYYEAACGIHNPSICDCFSSKQIALVLFAKRVLAFYLVGVLV